MGALQKGILREAIICSVITPPSYTTFLGEGILDAQLEPRVYMGVWYTV